MNRREAFCLTGATLLAGGVAYASKASPEPSVLDAQGIDRVMSACHGIREVTQPDGRIWARFGVWEGSDGDSRLMIAFAGIKAFSFSLDALPIMARTLATMAGEIGLPEQGSIRRIAGS